MKSKALLASAILGLIALNPASIAYAQSSTTNSSPTNIMLPNPLGISSVEDLLSRILSFLLYLATPIAVIMIMWSAYLFLFSGGDTKKVETAKQTLWYVVIGYAILLLAQGVTSIIKSFLGA